MLLLSPYSATVPTQSEIMVIAGSLALHLCQKGSQTSWSLTNGVPASKPTIKRGFGYAREDHTHQIPD